MAIYKQTLSKKKQIIAILKGDKDDEEDRSVGYGLTQMQSARGAS